MRLTGEVNWRLGEGSFDLVEEGSGSSKYAYHAHAGPLVQAKSQGMLLMDPGSEMVRKMSKRLARIRIRCQSLDHPGGDEVWSRQAMTAITHDVFVLAAA